MKFFGRGNNNNGQNNNGEKNQPSPSNSPVSPNRQGPPSQRTVDESKKLTQLSFYFKQIFFYYFYF